MVIFPIALFFILGYLFKRYFAYPENTGQIVTRIILNITLPPAVFLAASNTENFSQAYFLPLAALLIQLSMFGIFFLFSKKLQLDKNTECIFVTSPLINNTLLFLLPFIALAYGDQGVTRVVLYDIGNAFTIYFIAHALIKFYGGSRFTISSGLRTILSSPPLWALALGFFFAAMDLTVPEYILQPLLIMKDVNIFLPIFVLGFYFLPALKGIKLVLFTVTVRSLLGLLLGVGISFFFTDPLDKLIVVMAAAAPIGLLSLIYSSEYNRNTTFSSNIVSYSMILSMVLYMLIDIGFRSLGLI